MFFTISEISVQSENGEWRTVAAQPIEVRAQDIASGQILLKEAFIEPGAYRAVRIAVANASIDGRNSRASLAPPESGGVVVAEAGFGLRRGQSFVLSLAWDPGRSVASGYRFQPEIRAEPQEPSPRGLLLFVSNSGSNYLSIIDRSLERVVGALTVGERPMGMAANVNEDLLYVVDSGSRSISVVNAAQNTVQDRIPIPAGIGPTDIAYLPDTPNDINGKLYVINRGSNDVTVFSTLTRRLLKTIFVGTRPSAVAVDADRKEVYVTNEVSNNLSIISGADDNVAATVNTGIRPRGMIVAPDTVYVLNEGSNDISMVSKSQRKSVGAIPLSTPPARGMTGFNGRLFVANTSAGAMTFINSLNVVTRTIPLGDGPFTIVGDEARNRLYVTNYGGSTVTLAEPLGEMLLKRLYVGKEPYSAVLLSR